MKKTISPLWVIVAFIILYLLIVFINTPKCKCYSCTDKVCTICTCHPKNSCGDKHCKSR